MRIPLRIFYICYFIFTGGNPQNIIGCQLESKE
uniref:Uncharacterized protein n=1 Tax=Siphoviridae sp. ctOb14 TaxID=2827862 RepID=A0A8S5SMY5_9CAUD|nr:MAG TPA: hypothetical protein [Siphoviridae sp. ctOb14]